MYWTLTIDRDSADVGERNFSAAGRFVLHRHRDSLGPHFDLRLELGGALAGWRIDGESLDGELWACDKASHPLRWLDVDGDAVRELAGTYCWVKRDRSMVSLRLLGEEGVWTVRAERAPGLSPLSVRSISRVLSTSGCSEDEAARLVSDGIASRQRAIERLCGLGRELDGAAFDEAVWRRVVESLSLEEIHAQLRTYEVRFDVKYPPAPVSRPEVLDSVTDEDRMESALAIART